MSQVVVVHPAAAASTVREPRDDTLVRERIGGDGRFTAEHGPFLEYERTLVEQPDGAVEERTTFRLDVRVWGLLFVPLYRRAFRTRTTGSLWWAPPERLDRRAASVLGHLCSLSLVGGYLGTLMTQTATYAADEFGSSTTAQSGALAATRAGVLFAALVLTLADRRGRRRMVAVAATAGSVLAATGAVAPNLVALAGTQVVARGFATGLLLLIAIVSAEEMPAGSRAYAYGLQIMTGGLGAGMCLVALPLADLTTRGWRLLYVLPLLFLPLIRAVLRKLPETQRFERPHVEAPVAGHGRRFWLLASTSLLVAVFAAPASQLLNEFLKDERGYSATDIVLFTTVTVAPASIGIVIGGRLSDVRGRRVIAGIGIAGGTLLTVAQFGTAGPAMWLWGIASSVPAGLAVPSFAVYRSELFPTSLRGRLGGIVEALAVSGSAVGLLTVGKLVDRGASYGEAFAWIAAGPLAVVVIVALFFPETAHRELEDINPEDQLAAEGATGS